MRRFGLVLFLALSVVMAGSSTVMAQSTSVPGHRGDRIDGDVNGYPDEGVVVNGHYTAVYYYDVNEDYYWDLGDGRIYKTVDSVEDLDQATLTQCDYVVNYRGTFENDPFQDSGWIMNNINCHGALDNGQYNSIIVHKTDPRYTGNGGDPGWGEDWEYHTDVWSGAGNMERPENHIGN